MNILFFLEPSIELNNPVFRYATLRNSFIPQIKYLRSKGHNVITFVGEPVASKCLEENKLDDIGTMAVIDPVEWTNGEGYFSRSVRHQNKEYNVGEVEDINIKIKKAINDDLFSPDLIISWESPVYYMDKVYPAAKVIYQMPGVFSRPPFANLVSFDTGLLSESSDIIDYIPSIDELNSFDYLRTVDDEFISSINPARHMIEKVRREHSKIILFPLQIDNYFMISSVIGRGVTQFDILVDVLKKTPKDVAVLVTNYISKDTKSAVLSRSLIDFLRRKYNNFKFFEETDHIPCVSQYLIKDVDAVISISSSLGYQAAFWKKPLLVIGQSHISTFSTANSYDELIAQIFASKYYPQDNKLISLIKHKNLPQDCFSNNKYSDWLESFVVDGHPTQWCDDVGNELLNRRRENIALESLVPYINKFGVHSDYYCQELSQQIKRHEIISFDIFDTLLFRPFRHPSDLYDFIEEKAREITGIPYLKFKEERKKAEKIAFEAAIAAGNGEITIYDIYSVLRDNINLSDERCETLMQYEMQSEYEILYPRKTGYRAYLEAKQLGKRIIFVSDMYLPADFLAKVLDKNGYSEYEKLYVSSSIGLKKHSGALFDYVLEDLQVSPNFILHIGDNVDADVKRAKEKGIKPFHLMKAYGEYISCSDYMIPWLRDEKRHSLDWSMLLTIAGNNLHDNPYLPFRKNTIFGGSPTKLGYYGFGFLLIGYAKWLIENAIRDNVKRLYFLSRDGKIMKQVYDIVAKLYDNPPESHYLLCSRRAVNLAKVKTCDDIIDLVNVDYANNVRLSHLLLNRFGLDVDNLPEETLQKHGFNKNSKLTNNEINLLQDLLIDLKDEVLKVAENERLIYLQYLNQEGIYDDGKVSIVDIGYAGTMQQSLYQLSPNNKKIGGYYLITFRPALKRVAENDLDIKGYLAEFIDRHDTYHNFCRHVPLYETLFSASDTTFVRMTLDWNNNLTPVFMGRSSVEDKRVKLIEEIQNGAINYAEDVVRILGKRFISLDIEPNKTLRILDIYFSKPHPRDAKILSGIVFEDAYGGTQYKTILPEIENINAPCVWQQGKAALLNDKKNNNTNVKTTTENIKNISLDNDFHNEEKRNDNLNKKIIYFVLSKVLNEKKRKKFITNPWLFFSDSKSLFIKKIGRVYMS